MSEEKEHNDSKTNDNTKEEIQKNDDINYNNENESEQSLRYSIIKDEITSYDMSFKIIIIGDSFVGKSCLTTRATKNIFDNYYTATVGFEFFTFACRINDQNVRLQIWDTCGQEEYRSLIQNFYRNASIAILVYAIDKRESFENLEMWLNEIKSKGHPDVKIFLVGNKNDLEDKRVVSIKEGNKFYKDNKLNLFMETSAKSGENVQELFKSAAEILYKEHSAYKNLANKNENMIRLPESIDENNNIIDKDDDEAAKRKKKCCLG